MDKVFASIRINLGRLADPSGRESPLQFWPYAILVAVLNQLAGALLAAPRLSEMMTRLLQVIVEAKNRPVGQDPMEIQPLDPRLMLDMSGLAVPMAIILIVTISLLFSAVARRLHDRDKRAWWGLLPVPFQAVGLAIMPLFLDGFGAAPISHPGLFIALMLNNLLSFAALVLVIVLLAGKGTTGPNRFGPDPRSAQ